MSGDSGRSAEPAVSMARSWRHATVGLFGLSVLVYGFGSLTGADWAETCISRGVRFDPAYEFRRTAFPLSRPCNAEYDLVPVWMNVAVVLLVAATLACLVVAVVLTRRDRRAARTGE